MSIDNALSILCENAVDVISKDELKARLEAAAKDKRQLRVKAGFDPSSPDIHLGHTVLLRKLRQFQDAGHKVILIIGDATARIGDPTGQSKTRPILTPEQVKANAKTYQEQALKVLDGDSAKIEVVYNSQWLDTSEMLKTFLSIAGCVTVDQLLVRDDFDKRRKAHKPISLQEMFYPIMQGYDSVVVKADVELGGTDQLFNLLMGREIQSMYKMPSQIVMTLPLLVGLDGTNKMSKSLGNHIGVLDSAKDMFGKAMSIPDNLIENYYDLLVDKTPEDRKLFLAKIKSDPRNAKAELGVKIAAQYHGQKAGETELENFNRVFRDKQAPENLDVLAVDGPIQVSELLKMTHVATSTSGSLRLIEQGAVSIDGQKITDTKAIHEPTTKGSILKAGKKAFFKIFLKK